MDGEILSDRLAATEAAVIALDEKVDEIEEETPADNPTEPLLDHEGRIATLEARLDECLTKLQTLEVTATTAIVEATAAQEAAISAEALALETQFSEPIAEEEPLEAEVQEVEPEPESEGGAPEKSTKWWENLLTLR
jgi:hypothetical protein